MFHTVCLQVFNLDIRGQIVQHFTKMAKIRQKTKTGKHIFLDEILLFFSYQVNHLMTHQVILVTVWRDLTPRLETTGLKYLTEMQ